MRKYSNFQTCERRVEGQIEEAKFNIEPTENSERVTFSK